MYDWLQEDELIDDGLVKKVQDVRKEVLCRILCVVEGWLGVNMDVNKDDEGEVVVIGYGYEYICVCVESVVVVVGNSFDSNFDIVVEVWCMDVLVCVYELVEEVGENIQDNLLVWQGEVVVVELVMFEGMQ